MIKRLDREKFDLIESLRLLLLLILQRLSGRIFLGGGIGCTLALSISCLRLSVILCLLEFVVVLKEPRDKIDICLKAIAIKVKVWTSCSTKTS